MILNAKYQKNKSIESQVWWSMLFYFWPHLCWKLELIKYLSTFQLLEYNTVNLWRYCIQLDSFCWYWQKYQEKLLGIKNRYWCWKRLWSIIGGKTERKVINWTIILFSGFKQIVLMKLKSTAKNLKWQEYLLFVVKL